MLLGVFLTHPCLFSALTTVAPGSLKPLFGTRSTVYSRYISGTGTLYQAQEGTQRLPVMLGVAGQGTDKELYKQEGSRAGETTLTGTPRTRPRTRG